jgi:5-methylcytosine-specific restriction endonuclease McrA
MERPRSVTAKMILEIIERQNYLCALSGRRLTPETASLDHVKPLSRGGLHDLSNLWVLDHQVNNAKGTMTAHEFVALCHDVTANHPNAADSDAIGTSGG